MNMKLNARNSADLDPIAAGILRGAVAALDAIEGPRLGDFVRFQDGSLARISVMHEDGDLQAAKVDEGGFFLWKEGFTEFSGTCGNKVDPACLRRLDETMEGRVWTFRNGDVAPGGRVDTTVPFRVYAYEAPPAEAPSGVSNPAGLRRIH